MTSPSNSSTSGHEGSDSYKESKSLCIPDPPPLTPIPPPSAPLTVVGDGMGGMVSLEGMERSLAASGFSQQELIQLLVDEIRTNPVKTPSMGLFWKITQDILRLNGATGKVKVEGQTAQGHKATFTADRIVQQLQEVNPNAPKAQGSPHTVIPALSTNPGDRKGADSPRTPSGESLEPDSGDVS